MGEGKIVASAFEVIEDSGGVEEDLEEDIGEDDEGDLSLDKKINVNYF